MIDLQVFGDEIDGLSEYFGKVISEKQQKRLYLILNAELTLDEFKQAVIAAYRNCKFFPTPAELIESVHGTIEDLAIKQWDNTDNLSTVGCKAFDSVGGIWAKKNADKPDILRSQFLKAFKAYAVGANPADLRVTKYESKPLTPSPAIASKPLTPSNTTPPGETAIEAQERIKKMLKLL